MLNYQASFRRQILEQSSARHRSAKSQQKALAGRRPTTLRNCASAFNLTAVSLSGGQGLTDDGSPAPNSILLHQDEDQRINS
mmetsp:Transcript_31656/g.67209  ORF Transcript_31656/g.67209 Transcript_31656/m.67209 type:complete len:82 (+) Transcript_31656:76-321(+)